MKVYIAEEAGFCFGVKRALKIIKQLQTKAQGIQIYGQLIHNNRVMKNLAEHGTSCVDTIDQIEKSKKLVIRTHGIPNEIEEEFKQKGVDYIDATCPLVKRIHSILKNLNQKKVAIIIIGDSRHPEIIAAKSHAKQAMVINSVEEAANIQNLSEAYVVAQTTLDSDFLKEIISILVDKVKRMKIYNTICDATKERQEAIKKLAPTVDGVIVIGGKNSSNTKKLYNISKQRNANTFHLEESGDLISKNIINKVKNYSSMGITAGASTPYDEIETVKRHLECNK